MSAKPEGAGPMGLKPKGATWTCGTCGQPRGVRHTCRQRTDFKARRRKAATAEKRRKRKAVRERQAARRKQAAADRRARDRARKRPPRAGRARAVAAARHEPGTCGDRDCPKYGCKSPTGAGMARAARRPHEGE